MIKNFVHFLILLDLVRLQHLLNVFIFVINFVLNTFLICVNFVINMFLIFRNSVFEVLDLLFDVFGIGVDYMADVLLELLIAKLVDPLEFIDLLYKLVGVGIDPCLQNLLVLRHDFGKGMQTSLPCPLVFVLVVFIQIGLHNEEEGVLVLDFIFKFHDICKIAHELKLGIDCIDVFVLHD